MLPAVTRWSGDSTNLLSSASLPFTAGGERTCRFPRDVKPATGHVLCDLEI
jgi:hypothetical protein